eukprot:gnl/TRDRNA2_/TRDRNA2_155294_c0_seq1.p1 gnl/TRDRNA2_/TRDRNA2_155294_c0~~gnl/TRDRNA2_/TRDRNA2_155294_c0_seq1.p1  ORF type:complete len:365 (+),score=42.50 gnl/TRDRNA2_/TRDRNA2_155294_c0_seq1:45-1139(+)
MDKHAGGARNSHDTAVSFLKSAYKDVPTGFGGDFTTEHVDSMNMQYGEVTYAGMESLYGALKLVPGDVFYDLGSGVGKLVLYVALRGEVSCSIGLEVGEKRHKFAISANENLGREIVRRASLPGSNAEESALAMLDLPCAERSVRLADISKTRYHDASVVLMCNLCMDMGIQRRTLDQLLKCPVLKRLVCTSPLPHARLKLARNVKVACSWARTSSWHVYEVLSQEEAQEVLKQGRSGGRIRSTSCVRAISTPSAASLLETSQSNAELDCSWQASNALLGKVSQDRNLAGSAVVLPRPRSRAASRCGGAVFAPHRAPHRIEASSWADLAKATSVSDEPPKRALSLPILGGLLANQKGSSALSAQ